MANRRLVVHLVHGTWGRGVANVVREELGLPNLPHPPFWFEAGSAFRATLTQRLPECEFRHFNWSGSNSFEARSVAADALRQQLASDIKEEGSRHVLIGHSHAGNVIVESLAGLDVKAGEQQLLGVLTLATPFLGVEAEPDGFNLILHRLLPLILFGYALGLAAFNFLSGFWDVAGWLVASPFAYRLGMLRLQPSGWLCRGRDFLFFAAATFSSFCIGHAAVPWMATTSSPDSWVGQASRYTGPLAVLIISALNMLFLLVVRAAGSTPRGTYLLRDLIQAFGTVTGCVVLLAGSLGLMVNATGWPANGFLTVLLLWPFLSLGLSSQLAAPGPKSSTVDIWRAQARELANADLLPCKLDALRMASDEASLAIVASQLARATTASPKKILAWLAAWPPALALTVTATLAVFGVAVGYGQLHELNGTWRVAAGSILGMFEIAFAVLGGMWFAMPWALLLATMSHSLVGLAVGTDVVKLLPAVRVICEPLPRGVADQLHLTILWPSPQERLQLPLRHSMYDLPSVQARVALWLEARYLMMNSSPAVEGRYPEVC